MPRSIGYAAGVDGPGRTHDGGMPTTDDGRWIEIDGRRWRATDPAVAAPFRSELVHELMRARRAVRAGRTHAEIDAARRAVQRAKVALGERGEPWWEPTEGGRRTRLAATALALAAHRGPDGSICPSDVARAVGGPGWRGSSNRRARCCATSRPTERSRCASAAR